MSDPITLGGQLLFPSEYVGAIDLKGRDSTVTVSRIEMSDLQMQGGKKQRKPVVHFEKTTKKLVLNKTNARTIAALYGGVVEKWVGKKIILFPDRTRCGANVVDCIRVREYRPDQPRQDPVDGLGDDLLDDAQPPAGSKSAPSDHVAGVVAAAAASLDVEVPGRVDDTDHAPPEKTDLDDAIDGVTKQAAEFVATLTPEDVLIGWITNNQNKVISDQRVTLRKKAGVVRQILGENNIEDLIAYAKALASAMIREGTPLAKGK